MKKSSAKTATEYAVCAAAVYAALFALLWCTCRYTLCWQEDTGTFFSSAAINSGVLGRSGGVSAVAGLWLVQYFTTPVAAVAVTALLLTAIAAMTAYILRRISGTGSMWPLSVAPPMLLAAMHSHSGYIYGGSVAFAMLTGALCLCVMWRKTWLRLLSAAIAAPLLYLFVFGNTFYRRLSPNTDAPAIVFATYAVLLAAAFAVAYRRRKSKDHPSGKKGRTRKIWLYASEACALALFALMVVKPNVNTSDEQLCRLYVLAGEEKWDEILKLTNRNESRTPEMQAVRNLALACKGQLADMLFQQECSGYGDLYPQTPSPMTFVLLSDIHYHCGEIALARRFAFEANEAYDNMSPRLLLRLADTSLLAGDYAVAEKYLRMLLKTPYSDTAEERMQLVADPKKIATHPQLGAKMKSMGVPNKFAGLPNNKEDLKAILRTDATNTAAMQYLGCQYLAEKKIPDFITFIEEFYGSPALERMPVHFQEAIAVASIATGTDLATRYHVEPSIVGRCASFYQGRSSEPGTLWQYLK